MQTMTLEQAADFLMMHKETLRAKASNGEIPGRKPGRRWVFVDTQLADWLSRGHNPSPQALRVIGGGRIDKPQEKKPCQFTKGVKRTGSITTTHRVSEYKEVLGLRTKQKPSNSTTHSERSHGK